MQSPSAIKDMKKNPRHTHTDCTDLLPSGSRDAHVLADVLVVEVMFSVQSFSECEV
jgi:hypothetical protein